MTEYTFDFISIYWLIPVPIIFALLGLGLFHRFLGAAVFAGVSLLVSLFMYDSYLKSYTEEWLGKQRLYMIIFRDFPNEKERFVMEYVRAFESGGQSALAKKHQEMKIVTMAEYSKYYIEHTPAEVLSSYIIAETWLISTLFQKDYNLCQQYLADYKNFQAVWDLVGDEVFLTSVLYNPYIITEAVYNPQSPSDYEKEAAVELYRKLIRELKKSGARLSNEQGKIVSCDTMYRSFYILAQMPPKEAVLIIKLLYSDDHLGRTEPMIWLPNLIPF